MAELARSSSTPMRAAVSAVVPLSVSRTALGAYRWFRNPTTRCSAKADAPLRATAARAPARTAATDNGERTGTWCRQMLTRAGAGYETALSWEETDQSRPKKIRHRQRQPPPDARAPGECAIVRRTAGLHDRLMRQALSGGT